MPGKLTSIQDRKKLLRANLVYECGKGVNFQREIFEMRQEGWAIVIQNKLLMTKYSNEYGCPW
jgi:hypothetical protein